MSVRGHSAIESGTDRSSQEDLLAWIDGSRKAFVWSVWTSVESGWFSGGLRCPSWTGSGRTSRFDVASILVSLDRNSAAEYGGPGALGAEARRRARMRATLTVMSGLPDHAGRVFEVGLGTTTLGRSLGCDIQLANRNISRLHAERVWEGETLVLINKSQVNRTLVDGSEVSDRSSLAGGEEIMFADQVVLRLKIESIAVTTAADAADDSDKTKEANEAALAGSAAASESIEPEMSESASASSGPAPAPSPSSAPPESSTPATPPVGAPEPPSPKEAPAAATPDSPPPSATEVERPARHSFSFRCNPI